MPFVGISGGKFTHIDGQPVPDPSSVVSPPPSASTPRLPGLGDLVASLAAPIALLIDTATESLLTDAHKTALASCGACARRQNKLNLLCPDLMTCPVLGKILDLLPDWAREKVLTAAAERIKAS